MITVLRFPNVLNSLVGFQFFDITVDITYTVSPTFSWNPVRRVARHLQTKHLKWPNLLQE